MCLVSLVIVAAAAFFTINMPDSDVYGNGVNVPYLAEQVSDSLPWFTNLNGSGYSGYPPGMVPGMRKCRSNSP